MSPRIPLFLLAAFLLIPCPVNAGEIVKKSYTDADGKKVTGYVYRSEASKGRSSTYSRSRLANRYPAYRSRGYSSAHGRSVTWARGGCRPSRPAVQTTRTSITYNAACPTTISPRRRAGVTVYRRR